MAWVIPSSYDDCFLFCLEQGTLLHRETNQQSIFVQLNFGPRAAREGLVFVCDWMDARDGGTPFLSIYDLVERKGFDLQALPYASRHQMLTSMLDTDDYFLRKAGSNEFRISIPQLHPLADTMYLMDWLPSNYHGIIRGLRLTDDTPKNLHRFPDTELQVIGCDVPDQYFVRNPDGSPVLGHDMLYVNSLAMSRGLSTAVRPSGSLLRCKWVPTRQKWTVADPPKIKNSAHEQDSNERLTTDASGHATSVPLPNQGGV
jgi:hypothetical protein